METATHNDFGENIFIFVCNILLSLGKTNNGFKSITNLFLLTGVWLGGGRRGGENELMGIRGLGNMVFSKIFVQEEYFAGRVHTSYINFSLF